MGKIKATTDGKKGGILYGKSHAQGGIKAVVTDAGNKEVELEGGEAVVKKSALKDKTVKTLTGTNAQILNLINTRAGGNPIYAPSEVKMAKGGSIEDNCISFIKKSEAIKNNGYFHYFKNISIYADFGAKVPKVKTFYLCAYNSGGQKNLKVTDTLNLDLINKLQEIIDCEKSICRIIVNEFFRKAKRIESNDLSRMTGENIIVVDRYNIVCDNIKNEFSSGGSITPSAINNMTKAEQKAFYKTKEGKELDKQTYTKWKSLVNMSKGELESFYNSKEGKEAGLSASEAKAEGIDSGRESARWIMKMKDIPYTEWTSNMWVWAKKQISFVSRMKGMRGDLYDDKGNKTRKHLALLIWGHNPKKMAEGGVTGDVFSIKDPEQFKQLITLYNKFSEKFDVDNYFVDDSSVVFLRKVKFTDAELKGMAQYIADLSKNQNFSIISDKKPEISNGYFKFFLKERVRYEEGGNVDDDFDWNSLYDIGDDSEPTESDSLKENRTIAELTLNSLENKKNELEKELNDWKVRTYKKNSEVVYAKGDDILGDAYTIGGINEARKAKRIKLLSNQITVVDKSISILKEINIASTVGQSLYDYVKDGWDNEARRFKLNRKNVSLKEEYVLDEAYDTLLNHIKDNSEDNMAEGGNVGDTYSKTLSAIGRFKPKETIFFNPPLVGVNGVKLISYTWAYEWTMLPNREGEMKDKRVSDWTKAESSAETGRDIVHQYTIEEQDGSLKTVSSESVPILLGYSNKSQSKTFGNLATASKTLAKQQIELSILEAKKNEFDDALKSIIENGFPNPKVVKGDGFRPYKLFIGDASCWINDDGTYDEERLKCAKDGYINNRLSEIGINYYSYSAIPSRIYDVKKRIEKQKRKINEILSADKMAEGGNVGNDSLIYELGGSILESHNELERKIMEAQFGKNIANGR